MKKIFNYTVLFLLALICSCKGNGRGRVHIDTRSKNAKTLKISFLNTENLFDENDNVSKKRNDFTAWYLTAWNKSYYQTKLKNIAKTIKTLDADILGLAEIENEKVAKDLLDLLGNKYQMTSFTNPTSGLNDVVLFYKSDKVKVDSSQLILPQVEYKYNNYGAILYAKLIVDTANFGLILTHFPHPADVPETVISGYHAAIEKLLAYPQNKTCILMGDFNSDMKKNIVYNISDVLDNPFKNTASFKGTQFDGTDWLLNDAILLKSDGKFDLSNKEINDFNFLQDSRNKNAPLPSFKPNSKTFDSYGTSDHFPISVDFLIL
jgi:endonuclease/exonuclease/phosphatase family metal-dependent hydrolase